MYRELRDLVVVGALACGVAAAPVRAQEFFGLGFLDPDAAGPYSTGYGISADGMTVVGESNLEAYRWRAANPLVLEGLGFLPGGVTSQARDASGDGSFVSGSSGTPAGGRAFRWNGGVMSDLGPLPGTGADTFGNGISADGLVVTGTFSGSFDAGGFHWLDGVGMIQLADLPFDDKACQSAFNSDPLSACKIDPPPSGESHLELP